MVRTTIKFYDVQSTRAFVFFNHDHFNRLIRQTGLQSIEMVGNADNRLQDYLAYINANWESIVTYNVERN